TGRAVDQVRASHQCRDRQDARPQSAAEAARARRRGDRMRRRDFLSGLACAVTAPPIARAQTTSSAIRKIGVVTLGVPQSAPLFKAFITGLHELGYEPGKNIVLEFRHAEGRADRLSDLVTDVIAQNVDVIVVESIAAAIAAKKASQTTPIVLAIASDPVG